MNNPNYNAIFVLYVNTIIAQRISFFFLLVRTDFKFQLLITNSCHLDSKNSLALPLGSRILSRGA